MLRLIMLVLSLVLPGIAFAQAEPGAPALVASAVDSAQSDSVSTTVRLNWDRLSQSFERSVAGDREKANDDLRAVALSGTPAAAEARRILDGLSNADSEPGSEADPWQQFAMAYQVWVHGEHLRARARLEGIRTTFARHPAGIASDRVLRVIDISPAPQVNAEAVTTPLVAAESELPDSSAPSDKDARIDGVSWDLASWQALNGLFIGIELCVLVRCEFIEGSAAAMAGAVSGLAIGITYSALSEGLYPRDVYTINSGAVWGPWIALNVYLMANGDFDQGRGAIPFLIGQIAGPLFGGYVSRRLSPTTGEVAFANSLGFWSAAVAGLFHGAVDDRSATESVLLTTFIASNVGLVAAALIGHRSGVSQSDTYLIDGSAVLGTLVGGLFSLGGYTDGGDDKHIAYAGIAVGMAVGVGVGTWFALQNDATDDDVAFLPVSFTVASTRDEGWIAGVRGEF